MTLQAGEQAERHGEVGHRHRPQGGHQRGGPTGGLGAHEVGAPGVLLGPGVPGDEQDAHDRDGEEGHHPELAGDDRPERQVAGAERRPVDQHGGRVPGDLSARLPALRSAVGRHDRRHRHHRHPGEPGDPQRDPQPVLPQGEAQQPPRPGIRPPWPPVRGPAVACRPFQRGRLHLLTAVDAVALRGGRGRRGARRAHGRPALPGAARSPRRGAGGGVAVVTQEQVLERRRLPGDVDDVEPGQRAEHVADTLRVDPERDQPAVDAQVVHPASGGEAGEPAGALDPVAGGAHGHRRAGQVAQLGEVARLDAPAVTDDRHGVAQALDLAEDVAAEQHGGAPLVQVLHLVAEGRLHEGVEPGRRLVEEEELGVGRQGRDQGDLLPVARGVGAHLGRQVEPEALDEGGLAGQVDPPVHPGQQVEGLAPGEGRPERHVAGHVGDAGVQLHGVGPRVEAEHPRRPAVGADQAEQDADRRGLARSVGPEEAAHLPGLDDQVQPVERGRRAERLGQLPGLENR